MERVEKFKIFMVDDDVFCLNIYEQHLKNLGYNDIHLFENGTECLNNIMMNPDVVFLDHSMDHLNGFEVLKKIKRYNPNIYVVIVSGQEDMRTAIDSLKFGAFDYIVKGAEETEKMADVLKKISDIQEALKNTKPTLLQKILSIL